MKRSTRGCYQAGGGLKRELTQALRTGRTVRKPQRRPDQRTSRFVDPMIAISERPAEVEGPRGPEPLEGDLIVGKPIRPAIATPVERTTRYTMLVHLPEGHHAETVRRSGRHDRQPAGPPAWIP